MPVRLVCEGSPNGLDDRVLDALVVQKHNLTVLIEAASGGKGLGAVRTYLEGRHPQDKAISIEDRDHRPRADAEARWGNPAGRSFIWRRHEIENYLVHPAVVLELFKDFRTSGDAWPNSLPATEADASALLQALATPLLEDHVAQVLKEAAVQQINGIGSLSFGPRAAAPGAGAHTPGQAQWLAALQQEADRLCQTCNAVAALPDLQPAAIAARFQALLGQFQATPFLTSGEYLIDMGGTELLAALARYLQGLGAPAKLNQDELADELLKVLGRIYQPNSMYQPDDFVELATILRQY